MGRQQHRHATLYRQPIDHTPSMVSSITNRIRPMNLKRMYYDCRMVQMMVTPVVYALRNRIMTANPTDDKDWSESYAEIITIDPTEYKAPI